MLRLTRLNPATGDTQEIPPPKDGPAFALGLTSQARTLALAILIDFLENIERANSAAKDFVMGHLCNVQAPHRINGDRSLTILEHFETSLRSSQEEG